MASNTNVIARSGTSDPYVRVLQVKQNPSYSLKLKYNRQRQKIQTQKKDKDKYKDRIPINDSRTGNASTKPAQNVEPWIQRGIQTSSFSWVERLVWTYRLKTSSSESFCGWAMLIYKSLIFLKVFDRDRVVTDDFMGSPQSFSYHSKV